MQVNSIGALELVEHKPPPTDEWQPDNRRTRRLHEREQARIDRRTARLRALASSSENTRTVK